jgi:hypothetical protein
MNEDTDGRRRPVGRGRPGWLAAGLTRAALLSAALAGAALLAAGCGGGSPAAAPSAHPGQLTAQTMNVFAQCMRSHGVPDFYFSRTGSTAAAGLTSVIELGQWVAPANPSSPQFQQALKACQHLLPMHLPTAAQLQQQLRREVQAAACMRAHGYPDYPDPSAQDGHMVRPQLPAGIDTSSPQFLAALQTCNGG